VHASPNPPVWKISLCLTDELRAMIPNKAMFVIWMSSIDPLDWSPTIPVTCCLSFLVRWT
jgi:hypothetical protein